MRTYTHDKRRTMSDVEAINTIADVCEEMWDGDDIGPEVHLFDMGIEGSNGWPVVAFETPSKAQVDALLKGYIAKKVRVAFSARSWASVKAAEQGVSPSEASDSKEIYMLVLLSPSGRRTMAMWDIKDGKLLPRVIMDKVETRVDAEISQANSERAYFWA